MFEWWKQDRKGTCTHMHASIYVHFLSLTHTHSPPPSPHDIHKTITHSCSQRLLLYPKVVVLKVLLFCSQCQCIQKKKHTAFYALCVIVNNKDLFDLIWSAMLQRRSKIKYNVCVSQDVCQEPEGDGGIPKPAAWSAEGTPQTGECSPCQQAWGQAAQRPHRPWTEGKFCSLLRISEGIVLGPDWWLNILFRG